LGHETIDGLEVFCGLIFFANARAEDKIRSIFALYDFNDTSSLSQIEVKFCIMAVLSAILKITDTGEDVQEQEIHPIISRFFPEGAELKVEKIIEWCSKFDEARQLFVLLN